MQQGIHAPRPGRAQEKGCTRSGAPPPPPLRVHRPSACLLPSDAPLQGDPLHKGPAVTWVARRPGPWRTAPQAGEVWGSPSLSDRLLGLGSSLPALPPGLAAASRLLRAKAEALLRGIPRQATRLRGSWAPCRRLPWAARGRRPPTTGARPRGFPKLGPWGLETARGGRVGPRVDVNGGVGRGGGLAEQQHRRGVGGGDAVAAAGRL
mmetsp:Transcript_15563/g.43532  ORF Transcript_15563/g.43532 Transcript_15563/m.43532 type:complete len:207 (-) Transcript_15563:1018-1638(-)